MVNNGFDNHFMPAKCFYNSDAHTIRHIAIPSGRVGDVRRPAALIPHLDILCTLTEVHALIVDNFRGTYLQLPRRHGTDFPFSNTEIPYPVSK